MNISQPIDCLFILQKCDSLILHSLSTAYVCYKNVAHEYFIACRLPILFYSIDWKPLIYTFHVVCECLYISFTFECSLICQHYLVMSIEGNLSQEPPMVNTHDHLSPFMPTLRREMGFYVNVLISKHILNREPEQLQTPFEVSME